MAISAGASGSPVLNADGEVVGVVFCGDFPKAGEPAIRTYSVDIVEVRTVLTVATKKLGSGGNDEEPRFDGQPEGSRKKGRLQSIDS